MSRAEALSRRGGETGLFFSEELEAQLMRLNPGILDLGRAQEVIRQLRLLTTDIAGNYEMHQWMLGLRSVFVPEQDRERNVTLIDFDEPDNNEFCVTDEWVHQDEATKARNRADAVFLINGLPVALAETKKEGKPDGIAEGVKQVRRYHRETPELCKAPQVFEVTELLDFYYGPTWSTGRKSLSNWHSEDAATYEQKVKTFFHRPDFLRMLHDYVLFLSEDDRLKKVILRPHQKSAVERVVGRVHDPQKRRGLVWHTQGSGKTLTMITIAARLLREVGDDAEKPTVLMLVDRNELESQLFKNLSSYGIGTFRIAQSKDNLQTILSSDYRGLVVSTIHKFDGVPADVNTRESITVLVDEAHRTTGGDLGNYLEGALPNANLIGFTGTPIDKKAQGRSTFQVFGREDEKKYLDKYSIRASIEDGTTLKLNYGLAPTTLQVDREALDAQFLKLSEAEGISDVEELDAILDRAVSLREMMKNAERIDQIAAFTAEHFRENVEPMGFKSFFVAVDREACALYKEAFDRYLPPSYTEVVYSRGHNDGELLKRHHKTDEQKKVVRKRFRKKDAEPKLLIVTEKLLTGFDAPILYCMYLDKPMRDHVLLQAIARVNRPYEDAEGLVKPFGFVLDFVGMFDKLEEALAFDSQDVAEVIQDLDVLRERFKVLMRGLNPDYVVLAQGQDDKARERAIQYFENREERQTFFGIFRQLQDLYTILSPDSALRPHLETYKLLSELYEFIRRAYSDRVYVDDELTQKTKELLRRHVVSSEVIGEDGRAELPGAIHELSVEALASLQQRELSDTTKLLNLRKVLVSTVERERSSKPFVRSIGERAQGLVERYENRQLATEEALSAFEELAEEYLEADRKREELGLDENTFAIYVTLRSTSTDGTTEGVTTDKAEEVDALFEQYPDYQWNEEQQRELRVALYKMLVPISEDVPGAIERANALIALQRV